MVERGRGFDSSRRYAVALYVNTFSRSGGTTLSSTWQQTGKSGVRCRRPRIRARWGSGGISLHGVEAEPGRAPHAGYRYCGAARRSRPDRAQLSLSGCKSGTWPEGHARQAGASSARHERSTPQPALAHAARVRTLQGIRLIPLEDLVRMKLTSFRSKGETHLKDLDRPASTHLRWRPACPRCLRCAKPRRCRARE